MKLGLIFGRIPEMSYCECLSVAKRQGASLFSVRIFPQGVIWEGDEKDAKHIFHSLGGSIKLFQIISSVSISLSVVSSVEKIFTPEFVLFHLSSKKKPRFGMSAYSLNNKGVQQKIITDIKKFGVKLRKSIPKSRFVIDRHETLSSVSVQKQGLLSHGAEFLIFFDEKHVMIGKTIEVQAFEALGERDVGRPFRDLKSGILPPKLARVLINLSEIPFQKIMLDPFCGSGTILQEGLILGYRNMIGSDQNPSAISRTQKNIAWLLSAFPHLPFPKLIVSSLQKLSEKIPARSVDAIVTEPYLGPSIRTPRQRLPDLLANMTSLYDAIIRSASVLLKKNGALSIIVPFYIFKNKKFRLPIFRRFFHSQFLITLPDISNKYFHLSERRTLDYQRPGQWVGREIISAKLKN